MLNVELPHGLKGASLIQHSTLKTQHSTQYWRNEDTRTFLVVVVAFAATFVIR